MIILHVRHSKHDTTNFDLELAHRLRLRAGIKSASVQRLVFAGVHWCIFWTLGVFCSITTWVNAYPANMTHWPNGGLMLGRHRRRRANNNPSLGLCVEPVSPFCQWILMGRKEAVQTAGSQIARGDTQNLIYLWGRPELVEIFLQNPTGRSVYFISRVHTGIGMEKETVICQKYSQAIK